MNDGWLPLGSTAGGYSLTIDSDGIAERQNARHGEPAWTIGDALSFLHPTPPRRTLSRWLTRLEAIGDRTLPQGGPPARTYPAKDVMRLHAQWVRRITRNS